MEKDFVFLVFLFLLFFYMDIHDDEYRTIGRDDFSEIFLFHWYNLFEIFLREKFWVNVVEL